jgi:hypothetical protein
LSIFGFGKKKTTKKVAKKRTVTRKPVAKKKVVKTKAKAKAAPKPDAKESVLTRFAKALVRKAKAAYKAVVNRIKNIPKSINNVLTDHGMATESGKKVSVLKRIGRFFAAIPKLIAKTVRWAFDLLLIVPSAIVLAAMFLLFVVKKIVLGISLVLETPYNLTVSNAYAKRVWNLYGKSWTGEYFYLSLKEIHDQECKKAGRTVKTREVSEWEEVLVEAVEEAIEEEMEAQTAPEYNEDDWFEEILVGQDGSTIITKRRKDENVTILIETNEGTSETHLPKEDRSKSEPTPKRPKRRRSPKPKIVVEEVYVG